MPPVAAPTDAALRIFGARVHNLKNLDLALPLERLTVITGVSGSGKSSLAFDTIYAEGQRRYVESLSAYARQFLERMEKPEVDAIEGIAPAVAIRQKSGSRTPRSTVGTATEIYDYLRLLMARVGETRCPDCDLAVGRDDPDRALAAIYERALGRRALLLFPVAPPAEAAAWPARLTELRGKGFNRLVQGGKTVEFSTPESLLELDLTLPLFVLLDRVVIEPEARTRMADAIETAYREAGEVRVEFPTRDEAARGAGWAGAVGSPAQPSTSRTRGEATLGPAPRLDPLRFHLRFECKHCGRKFEEPEPRLFSFNNPFGACPGCQGFGRASDISEARVVPDPFLSLEAGAIEPWNKPARVRWRTALKRHAAAQRIPMDVPWRQLTREQRRLVWDGGPRFPGVKGFFERLERKRYKVRIRVLIARYRGYNECPVCHGARLRQEAQWIWLTGANGERHNMAEVTRMSVAAGLKFFQGLALTPERAAIAGAVLTEIRRRLEYLLKVGLDYITLDRLSSTLSGGEAQRIQLATCLGSQLVGSLYVLDEPSIGLHPRDTRRLIGILHELRDLGNTIVVVEHDPEVMRASDHLVDLGPAAGEQGGQLVAAGTWQAVRNTRASLTGQYLRGDKFIPAPAVRRTPGRKRLVIRGARAHNLQNIDVTIPLGLFVAVTGVSGSGKSTLVHEVLYRNLRPLLAPVTAEAGSQDAGAGAGAEEDGGGERLHGCRELLGAEHVRQIVLVDQSPIGRTPRSNPVTYLKAFDAIRELFAALPAAKKRGYRAGHFSFNVPGGRCEICQGDGVVTVDMQFLADVELPCEECSGTRYQSGILEVRFREKNIHEVLQMTADEAAAFFAGHPKVLRGLQRLREIGLGYLRLGQSATTLSGGEAQRLKLAAHLAQPQAAAQTLFLFDEPTTGLHFDDIAKLLAALQRLVEAGGTVLVIEHNLELIKAADWILELGPEAGPGGGQLVTEGPPEEVAASRKSHTAPFLAEVLSPVRK